MVGKKVVVSMSNVGVAGKLYKDCPMAEKLRRSSLNHVGWQEDPR